jgi:PRTRC genetic system protein E
MFKELLPILAKRSFILTLNQIQNDAERMRVTVVPKPIKGKDEPKALFVPFELEGTVEELEADLPKGLVSYTSSFMTLERSLEQMKTSTEAALAEAKAEADKKVADAKAKNKTVSKPAVKPATAKPEPVKAPEPPSLFDAAATQDGAPETPATAEVAAPATSDDSDDDPPKGPNGSDDDSDESDDDSDDQAAQANVAAIAPAVIPVSQPSMFDQEQEILEEAFNGAEDRLIAA